MLPRPHRRRARALFLLPIVAGGLLPLLAGCHKEERAVSPNESTAAPARLPGEDPHAHHSPGGADNGKKPGKG